MFNEQTRHITMLIAYAEALYFKTNTYQRLVCNYALLTEWQMYHFLKKIWSYISDRRMKFVKKWEKDLCIVCAGRHGRCREACRFGMSGSVKSRFSDNKIRFPDFVVRNMD